MNQQPIDVVLPCPKCGLLHVDAPDPDVELTGVEIVIGEPPKPYPYKVPGKWQNPPHKSHLCAGCGHVWRPSDHPTNGVLRTASGKDDDCTPSLFPGHVRRQALDRAAYDAIMGRPPQWQRIDSFFPTEDDINGDGSPKM